MSYSIGKYEGSFSIPEFRGIRHNGDNLNTDTRYATDEKNCDVVNGMLQPMAVVDPAVFSIGSYTFQTLAKLTRRWHAGTNGEYKEMIVGAAGGKLYAYFPNMQNPRWQEIPAPLTPPGEDLPFTYPFQSNVWSWVTYEINPDPNDDPYDVLILSNPVDGMFMVRAYNTAGSTIGFEQVETPKKFGVIERYAERIWGGDIIDDPDLLMYSAPYDFTDWEQNTEIPEDGAGEVRCPSWDGDSFTALKAFGDQLIAFKKNRVWRILGTNPGEYTFKEQYGGGSSYENTIAVSTENIIMLSDDGLQIYDGLSVTPFQRGGLDQVWRRVNKSKLEKARAVLWKNRYYLAVPLDNASSNNAVLVWDSTNNTWLKYESIRADCLLGTDESLYYTNTKDLVGTQLYQWKTDCWESNTIKACTSAKWVTPWTDLGAKDIAKDSFEIYMTVEANAQLTLRVTLETERRAKYRDVVIPATVTTPKQTKIFIGGTGRKFRLIFEWLQAGDSTTKKWRILDGVLVKCSLDRDS